MELVYVLTAYWGDQYTPASVAMAVPQPGLGGAFVNVTLRNLKPSTTYQVSAQVRARGVGDSLHNSLMNARCAACGARLTGAIVYVLLLLPHHRLRPASNQRDKWLAWQISARGRSRFLSRRFLAPRKLRLET